MSTKLGIIGLLSVLCLFSTEAKAHYLLDDAIASYEDADFRAALRTFNLAARDADLSVEELLLLFEMRALVHHAMGNETAMLRDLERVGALRPTHQLGGLAPPPVRTAFDDMLEANGGTLGVELVIEERVFDGKPFVVARVEKVPKDLVHHIGLQCRVPPLGRAIARTAQGTRARIALPESGAHQGCDATAQTRRGTVLFSASIEGTLPESPPPSAEPPAPAPLPRPVPVQSPSVFQMPEYKGPVDQPTAKKKKKWPWIVAAAAVAVAGGVTAGVILSKNSKQSQPAAGGVTVSW
ncbi:MAG: hypothetical protein WBN14_10205 [Polyangiales bacterium]